MRNSTRVKKKIDLKSFLHIIGMKTILKIENDTEVIEEATLCSLFSFERR